MSIAGFSHWQHQIYARAVLCYLGSYRDEWWSWNSRWPRLKGKLASVIINWAGVTFWHYMVSDGTTGQLENIAYKYWRGNWIPNSCRESSLRQNPSMACLTELQNLYQSKQRFSRTTLNLKAPFPPLFRADGRLCQGRTPSTVQLPFTRWCVSASGWVCVLGFKTLACLFPHRVTGVLMACQVSLETRDTGWDGFNNLSLSRLKGRLRTADVY